MRLESMNHLLSSRHLVEFRAMWNHEQNPTKVDNVGVDVLVESVSSRREIERTYELPWRQMMWTGRLYTDPKPVIPQETI